MTQARRLRRTQRGFLVAAAFALVCVVLAAGARPVHAASFTVNSTGDDGDQNTTDGVCDTGILIFPAGEPQCTLRAAIQQANAVSGADTMNFNIPGGGVKTISPTSELPRITDQVTIDGYTQPGASKNTLPAGSGNDAALKIELDGSGTGFEVPALTVGSGGSGTTVRGLVVNDSGGSGIHLFDSDNNKIEGNFIGTDPSGTNSEPNYYPGVIVDHGTGNTVGGTEPEARNVISGNQSVGVYLDGDGNRVLGNLIGVQSDGASALGNGFAGVMITRSFNTVGGSNPDAMNVIRSTDCQFCGGLASGVAVIHGGVGNRILGNPIFSNTGMGIDLDYDGQTPNDPKDPDTGPNNLQNYPVLQSATKNPDGTTTIKGTLDSTPSVKRKIRRNGKVRTRVIRRTFTIQFFSNPAGEDQGKTFLGQRTVTTNLQGTVSFTFTTDQTVSVGEVITTTAMRNSTGDTSEFSPATAVQ